LRLGIVTRSDNYDELNYETRSIIDAARAKSIDVTIIDPLCIIFQFLRGEKYPQIQYKEKTLEKLDYLIVRSSRGREKAISLLVNTLNLMGCRIVDSTSRFSPGLASKLLTTLSRHSDDVGSDSFFAFSDRYARILAKFFDKNELFPIIVKPIAGKQGIGINVFKNLDELNIYISDFFINKENKEGVFFAQRYTPFVDEYRVLVVDGEEVGTAQKIPRSGSITANAAQGAVFRKVENHDITRFVINNVSNDGILGVDAAVGENGEFHIIEANRSPLWKEFDHALNINSAQIIINKLFE
jgi:glutathione synthase/RimK-type ligase-like ATP-grasp enzyme